MATLATLAAVMWAPGKYNSGGGGKLPGQLYRKTRGSRGPKVFEWCCVGHDQIYLIEDSGGQPQHLQVLVLQTIHFNLVQKLLKQWKCNLQMCCEQPELCCAGAGWHGFCCLINTNTRGDSSLEITATGFNYSVKT